MRAVQQRDAARAGHGHVCAVPADVAHAGNLRGFLRCVGYAILGTMLTGLPFVPAATTATASQHTPIFVYHFGWAAALLLTSAALFVAGRRVAGAAAALPAGARHAALRGQHDVRRPAARRSMALSARGCCATCACALETFAPATTWARWLSWQPTMSRRANWSARGTTLDVSPHSLPRLAHSPPEGTAKRQSCLSRYFFRMSSPLIWGLQAAGRDIYCSND